MYFEKPVGEGLKTVDFSEFVFDPDVPKSKDYRAFVNGIKLSKKISKLI